MQKISVSHLKFLKTAVVLIIAEWTMQLTLVSKVVSLTEASAVHMGAEGSAPLVTVTLLTTARPPAPLLTWHTVPGDMVTLVTSLTLTLPPTVQAPPPLATLGLTARPLVSWPTCTRAVSLKIELFTSLSIVLDLNFPGYKKLHGHKNTCCYTGHPRCPEDMFPGCHNLPLSSPDHRSR